MTFEEMEFRYTDYLKHYPDAIILNFIPDLIRLARTVGEQPIYQCKHTDEISKMTFLEASQIMQNNNEK